ncbi:hypothetical protein V2J09_018638 [Rumex salicifolius]
MEAAKREGKGRKSFSLSTCTKEGDEARDKKNFGGRLSLGLRSLFRRKQVDSIYLKRDGHELAKRLVVPDLIAIGVGATIGAGVYILVGTVAREDSGPALTISFLIAGIAAALSAFCYAELACRCPSAGSAYHYSYICVGECAAWLIGWGLILEYTIGGAAVARGISPNLALYFGGGDNLPSFLVRHTVFGITVDPCAAVLVFIVTALLCVGVKESTSVQAVVTAMNVCCMIFIIVAGGYLAFQVGWPGYQLSSGYFPYGFKGVLAGSTTVFFSYIGFDSVASTAEEVKNPQRDLPLGIGIALSICCTLYMLVSVVIVGLVPYNDMDEDTPISSAFSEYGMQWAAYIVTTGAVMALCATLLGSLLPQPRILMAMARDGLLPSFFSDINKQTQVPVKSTIVTGFLAAALAFTMNVSQLAGMVSVGTLLAFTIVAISVLILRYIPPQEMPMSSCFQESIASFQEEYSSHHAHKSDLDINGDSFTMDASDHDLLLDKGEVLDLHVLERDTSTTLDKEKQQKRRLMATWSLVAICVGAIVLASAASVENISSFTRYILCGNGGVLFLIGLCVIARLDQDVGSHKFGHTGGFTCPFVPFLPVSCILINTYLLVNLGTSTWMRVSVWLAIGVIVYVLYGRKHSSLLDAIYVPTGLASEIYLASSDWSCTTPINPHI